MVAHPRKTPSPGPIRPVTSGAGVSGAVSPEVQFRSLNLPVPIEVVEDGAGKPVSIILPPARAGRAAGSRRPAQKGRSLAVTAINDLWQVDDEWWRERAISRRYYQVTTQDRATQDEGRLTIFRDQLNAQWHWQKGG